MGTQKSHGWNNNKRSYTAVLHRYIESKEMPSREEANSHRIEMTNHASDRPTHGDISPESPSSNTDKGSLNFQEKPNLPGIPLPFNYTENAPEVEVVGKDTRRMKTEVFNFLEGHKTFASKVYHHFIIFVTLSSIVFAVCSTLKSTDDIFSRRMRHVTLGYEVCLFLIFSIEYGFRVWSCSANSSYIGPAGRRRFILRPIMVLDGLAIVASFVLVITLALNLKNDEYRFLFLLQLFRVLRIDRHRGAFETFKCVVRNHFKELLTCWYMGFIVIMFLSYLTYADPTPDSKGTVPDLASGLYWGVVSMTTIGYGDVSPATGLSKLVLCIFALIGAGFIAMPAGIIGSGFALQVIEQKKLKQKTRRRRPAAELIQSVWRVFASDPHRNFSSTWGKHKKYQVSIGHSNRNSVDLYAFADRSNLNLQHDSWENIDQRELTVGEKHALGFIRRLKLNVAVRNFRQALRPFDVKDILDRFAATHVEIFERIKDVKKRVDSTKQNQDFTNGRLQRIEDQVNALSKQMDDVSVLLGKLVADKYPEPEHEESHV